MLPIMQNLQLAPALLATPHRSLLHTPTNTAILSDLRLGLQHTLGPRDRLRTPTPIEWLLIS